MGEEGDAKLLTVISPCSCSGATLLPLPLAAHSGLRLLFALLFPRD